MTDTPGGALLSVTEAAALLKKPARTVRYWAKKGHLRSYPTPSGRHQFRRADLEQWIVPEEVA